MADITKRDIEEMFSDEVRNDLQSAKKFWQKCHFRNCRRLI